MATETVDRLAPGLVVRAADGREGVTCIDLGGMLACAGPDETSVQFFGDAHVEGTETSTLTVIGPENPKPDMIKCGAGKGTLCCKFLTVSGMGPECERHTAMRWQLLFAKMVAEREPVAKYPDCMDQ